MPKFPKERCESCKWWAWFPGNAFADCRRRSPELVEKYKAKQYKFPTMRGDAWCGEWEKKDA